MGELLENRDLEKLTQIEALDERSREIFRQIVETFLETGDPVGSRNISRHLPMTLSPASVRNVMTDLEEAGLISQPHTSAGRLPTEHGLRLFVDGLLQIGDLTRDERTQIQNMIATQAENENIETMLGQAGELLSGLSHCAGLVLTAKQMVNLRQIEFLSLEPGKGLVVLVSEDGAVENRLIDLPKDLPASALREAANYLNARLKGRTLNEALDLVKAELQQHKAELDVLTAKVVQAGIASWSGEVDGAKSLIVRGRSKLLEEVGAIEELERIRQLFDDMETKKDLVNLLGSAEQAEGVRIFIGSENKLFSLSGSSVIAAPFEDSDRQIVGVLGVIGPTRLNYARIIPMVDYTAKLMSRLIR